MMSREEDIKRLLSLNSRRLQKFKEQQALRGARTDPMVLIQIEDLEAEIKKLEAELAGLEGVAPASLEAPVVGLPEVRLPPLKDGEEGQPLLFVSYSQEDEAEKARLLRHLGVLQRAGLVNPWSDDQIAKGMDWEAAIAQAVAQARVALLLITANFLTSDFILGSTVPALLKRRQQEGLVIFSVIARACAWRTVDWLKGVAVRPKSGRPVWADGGSHVDEDLTAIAEEVAALVMGRHP